VAEATPAPGRSCPRHYRYSPAVFSGPAALHADALYVVGGLYGNVCALEAILAMARDEGAALVFNGDFNWFNVDAEGFERVNAAVLGHAALRGNVETEIAAEDSGAGCGCGYPEWVGDAEVARSNAILERLRETARGDAPVRARLGALPMHLVAEVGGVRIGVVHGDAESLAGWLFSQELLRQRPERAARALEAAQVDVFASSHTCLPVMQAVATARGPVLVANNGAAGMPNFRGERFGIVTRIALAPSRDALYGAATGGVRIEAVPVRYDHAAWLARFDRAWPPGSPAAASYRERIVSGPRYRIDDAMRVPAERARAA
jgi:predicted phosphodiesterase